MKNTSVVSAYTKEARNERHISIFDSRETKNPQTHREPAQHDKRCNDDILCPDRVVFMPSLGMPDQVTLFQG
jgi:hypothetical protein